MLHSIYEKVQAMMQKWNPAVTEFNEIFLKESKVSLKQIILPSATEHADGIKKTGLYWKKISGNDQPLPDTVTTGDYILQGWIQHVFKNLFVLFCSFKWFF